MDARHVDSRVDEAAAESPTRRAASLTEQGNAAGAVAILRQAIAAGDAHWRLHYALGEALLAARRDEEAIAEFMAVHRLHPGHGRACTAIGRIYLTRGLAEPARMWLRFGLDADESDQDSVSSLAVAELRLGNRVAAEELLDAWVEAAPESAVRRFMRIAILGEGLLDTAPPDYVAHLFDDYAERFDESLARLRYCGPALIDEALGDCVPCERTQGSVLDVGCGTGLVGAAIRRRSGKLVGLDLSEKMLERAELLGVYDELVRGEMVELMHRWPGRFDVITASDVLTYVGDLDDFFAAARVALSPGGWVAVVLEALPSPADGQSFRLNPSGRFSHSEQALRDWLTSNGFTVHLVRPAAMRHELGRPTPSLVAVAQVDR